MTRVILISLFAIVTNCRLENSLSEQPIARVQDRYLYKSDISQLLNDNITSADSTTLVKNYIHSWAKEQLLLDKAVFNLNSVKQDELEALIRRYRNDLFIKTYQEEWLKARVDTLITAIEVEAYYQSNKQNFKLHQDLMRGRYIALPQANFNKQSVRNALRRFNEQDRTFLDSISLQFNSKLLNDSIWFRPQTFFSRIRPTTPNTYERYVKSNRYFELEDSINLYLVFIEEVRKRNEIAPMAHVKSTLEQILINKRKLDMLRQFDRDVLQEALNENIFEVYE